MSKLEKICKNLKIAATKIAIANSTDKNKILLKAAELLDKNRGEILAVNNLDVENAKSNNLSSAMIDRLILDNNRIDQIIDALKAIIELDDPVGKIIWNSDRPNGLKIKRMTVALGVLAVIYESRPNVTVDAFALCLKAGNAVILKPGSECFATAEILVKYLKMSLESEGFDSNIISMVPDKSRETVNQLLQMDQYIDVVVPRGGKNLITKVSEDSKIPVFKHLDGNCHTYIHSDADIEIAANVLYNAKLRRTGICGATESVLIDMSILDKVKYIFTNLLDAGCEIRSDNLVKEYLSEAKAINDNDFAMEYLDKIISVKSVKNIDEAITHINSFGSGHTDAIISENKQAQNNFFKSVDSAIVMSNTSTQFADGGEFGLGAEIGISTGRLHARGPVGLEQLVTYKYLVEGNGQLRD